MSPEWSSSKHSSSGVYHKNNIQLPLSSSHLTAGWEEKPLCQDPAAGTTLIPPRNPQKQLPAQITFPVHREALLYG